jgi:mersacidin/lichenicidin family type 2 lantibiotic
MGSNCFRLRQLAFTLIRFEKGDQPFALSELETRDSDSIPSDCLSQFGSLLTGETTMSKTDIIRAWKDEQYRSSLSSREAAMLPANPAGPMDLNDSDLGSVVGARTDQLMTYGCPPCGGVTYPIVLCALTPAIGSVCLINSNDAICS